MKLADKKLREKLKRTFIGAVKQKRKLVGVGREDAEDEPLRRTAERRNTGRRSTSFIPVRFSPHLPER